MPHFLVPAMVRAKWLFVPLLIVVAASEDSKDGAENPRQGGNPRLTGDPRELEGGKMEPKLGTWVADQHVGHSKFWKELDDTDFLKHAFQKDVDVAISFYSEKCSHCAEIKPAQEVAAEILTNASDGKIKFYRIDDFRFGSWSRDFSFSQLTPGFEDGNVPKVYYMKAGVRYPMFVPSEGIGYDGHKKLVEWVGYHSTFDKQVEAYVTRLEQQEAKAAWQKKRERKAAKERKKARAEKKKDAKIKKEAEKRRAAEREAEIIRQAEKQKAMSTSTTTPSTKKKKQSKTTSTTTTTAGLSVGDFVSGTVVKVLEDEILVLLPGRPEPARLVFSSDIVTEDFWVEDGNGGERPIAVGDPVSGVQVKRIDEKSGHITLIMHTEPLPLTEEQLAQQAEVEAALEKQKAVAEKFERLAKWFTSDSDDEL